MREIRHFRDQTEGVIAKEYLETQGIHGELRGSREYASIIVGGTVGQYALLVPDEMAAQAHLLLRKQEVQPAPEEGRPTEIPEVALKKAVMWAVIAIILLPWIGNAISVHQTMKYMRLERSSSRKWLWIFAISWLQVPGIVVGFVALWYLIPSDVLVS